MKIVSSLACFLNRRVWSGGGKRLADEAGKLFSKRRNLADVMGLWPKDKFCSLYLEYSNARANAKAKAAFKDRQLEESYTVYGRQQRGNVFFIFKRWATICNFHAKNSNWWTAFKSHLQSLIFYAMHARYVLLDFMQESYIIYISLSLGDMA